MNRKNHFNVRSSVYFAVFPVKFMFDRIKRKFSTDLSEYFLNFWIFFFALNIFRLLNEYKITANCSLFQGNISFYFILNKKRITRLGKSSNFEHGNGPKRWKCLNARNVFNKKKSVTWRSAQSFKWLTLTHWYDCVICISFGDALSTLFEGAQRNLDIVLSI